MNNEYHNSNVNSWHELISIFLTNKKEAEEEKYLKQSFKVVTEYYVNEAYFGDEEMVSLFNVKKEKQQSTIEFLRNRFWAILRLEKKPESFVWDEHEEGYRDKCSSLDKKYEPRGWIEAAACNAHSVSFATHVIKLTHSKIDSSSLYDQIDAKRMDMLTTSSLSEKIIDGAVSGNQFAPIFQFLELQRNGVKLASNLLDENSQLLRPYAENEEELCRWNVAFKKALVVDDLSSHFLSKQVYFPVEQKDNEGTSDYHLLCQVKSSSLAQSIFNELFSEQQKETNSLQQSLKYTAHTSCWFANKARLGVTASNHSNASQLNGKRGGKIYLFAAQPPVWESQLNPPIQQKSLFDKGFLKNNIKAEIDYLRNFLLRFEQLNLSTKDPKRQKWIDLWVNNIIDEFLVYVATIQELSAGWSANPQCELKLEHRYLLDPYRNDEVFQTERRTNSWQLVVCLDFAKWLNRQLQGKDKIFTAQKLHTRMWQQLLLRPLREFCQSMDESRHVNLESGQ